MDKSCDALNSKLNSQFTKSNLNILILAYINVKLKLILIHHACYIREINIKQKS